MMINQGALVSSWARVAIQEVEGRLQRGLLLTGPICEHNEGQVFVPVSSSSLHDFCEHGNRVNF